MRIALDEIMTVSLDALTLQALLEGDGGRLTVEMGDDNRTHHEATVLELATEAEHILIVSDAKVGTLLVLYDVGCTNHDNNLNAIADFLEHAQFAVRLKSWQDTAGVVVVEKLATQFEVKLSVKLRDSLLDMLRLNLQILLVVKSYLHIVLNCISFLVVYNMFLHKNKIRCKSTKKYRDTAFAKP